MIVISKKLEKHFKTAIFSLNIVKYSKERNAKARKFFL